MRHFGTQDSSAEIDGLIIGHPANRGATISTKRLLPYPLKLADFLKNGGGINAPSTFVKKTHAGPQGRPGYDTVSGSAGSATRTEWSFFLQPGPNLTSVV
jgi:hypothetical protein